MSDNWNTTLLDAETDALQVFADLRGKRWMCRGHSRFYDGLVPSIDRPPRQHLSRAQKLTLERRSIDLFRSTARFFTDQGEHGALGDDIVALMVLRHYDVPCRLLDWSLSPYVAAYFAARSNDEEDGEIWVFDRPLYEKEGQKQWEKWPETTKNGDGINFNAGQTAFTIEEPPDWFVCSFYHPGFHRQNAQQSAFSMTARLGRTHDAKIAELLKDPSRYHRYIIASKLKPALREILRKEHGVWRGSLFPDSAGAAETAKKVFECDEVE